MLREILRFNRESRELYESDDMTLTLGTYLSSHGYSSAFVDNFLVPMGAAIWSADPHQFLQFPAAAFVQFFTNHGILNVIDQPKWRVVSGGSTQYVAPLVGPSGTGCACPRRWSGCGAWPTGSRSPRGAGQPESFDQVVLACSQRPGPGPAGRPVRCGARAALGHPLPEERHGPAHRQPAAAAQPQGTGQLELPHPPPGAGGGLPDLLDEQAAIPGRAGRFLRDPQHPGPPSHRTRSSAAWSTTTRSIRPPLSRPRNGRHEINGVNRTWFCGAYWGYGFHEDGLKSALAVCRHFGKEL